MNTFQGYSCASSNIDPPYSTVSHTVQKGWNENLRYYNLLYISLMWRNAIVGMTIRRKFKFLLFVHQTFQLFVFASFQ
jgi:hypothetical protein